MRPKTAPATLAPALLILLVACGTTREVASTSTTTAAPAVSSTATTVPAISTSSTSQVTTTATTALPANTTTTNPPPDATATFTGEGCDYVGPDEFPAGTTVTFGYVNGSSFPVHVVGFSIWPVPDGTTSEAIREDGIFAFVEEDDILGWANPIRDQAPLVTVTFEQPGLVALNCFREITTDVYFDYAAIVTITG